MTKPWIHPDGFDRPEPSLIESLLARAEQLASEPDQTDSLIEAIQALEDASARFKEGHGLLGESRTDVPLMQTFFEQFEERKRAVYIQLLYSPDLAQIARVTGPLFLYRQQNAEIFSQAMSHRNEWLQGEVGGTMDVLSPHDLTEPVIVTDARPATSEELRLDELIKERVRLAKEEGFTSYLEYAWLKQERFDYSQPDHAILRTQVERYMVPIAEAFRRFWSGKPQAYDGSAEPSQAIYPQSGISHFEGPVEGLVDAFASCWPEWEPSSCQIEVSLDLRRRTTLEIETYPASGKIVLRGTIRRDMRSVYRLWVALAELLVRQKLVEEHWILENREPTAEVMRSLTHSMATLTMEDARTAAIWPKDYHRAVSMQLAWQLIFDLLGYMMRDEYESSLYQTPSLTLADRRSLWSGLAKRYWPGEVNPLDYRFFALRYARTIHELNEREVGDYLNRALGCLTAIHARDLERLQTGAGYRAIHAFMDQCGHLPLRSLYDVSGLPSLFHPDSLKRPAYQLAYQLGL